MRIEHVGLWTLDLERARRFYEQFFGARAGARYRNAVTRFESYFLEFGSGARLELMWRPDVAAVPESAAPARGYAHLALSVGAPEEVDALTDRLRRAGHPPVSNPRWTGDGYYESVIRDPEGNLVEITADPHSAETRGSGDSASFSAGAPGTLLAGARCPWKPSC